MEAYRSPKSGDNRPLKKSKIGFIRRKGGASPGKVLFIVRRSRVLNK